MPKINLTIFLKHLGTFFITIFIILPLSYFLQSNQAIPTKKNPEPIKNNHPFDGSNNTNNIPVPIPIRQTPIVFFNALNILTITSFILYIILIILYICDKK